MRCAACRSQASELTLTSSGLAAKKYAECARVNLFLCFVFRHDVTDCCCSLRVRISTERCAPGVLLLVYRPEPGPADSLATERRAARRRYVGRDATSLYSSVTIQLINRSAAACCRGVHHEFRDHAKFRFENLMAQAVGFRAEI